MKVQVERIDLRFEDGSTFRWTPNMEAWTIPIPPKIQAAIEKNLEKGRLIRQKEKEQQKRTLRKLAIFSSIVLLVIIIIALVLFNG